MQRICDANAAAQGIEASAVAAYAVALGIGA